MTRTVTIAPRTVTVVLVVLVAEALLLALTPAPTVLSALVVLPVLVGVAGSAATRLVLGPRAGRENIEGDDDADTDGLLRATLPIVLGIVALLGAVLLTAALGEPIATQGIAYSATVVTLVLVGAARWRTLLPSRGGPERGPTVAGFRPVVLPGRRILRAAAGVLGAAVVLAGAVACAIALRPVPVEQYTQIALDGPQAVSGSPLSARPGGAVTVDFTLSGYGNSLPDIKPQVDVTVGDTPARSPSVITSPPAPAPAGTGAVAAQSGSVVFLAPANEGLYTVRITVGASRSVLVTTLQVTS